MTATPLAMSAAAASPAAFAVSLPATRSRSARTGTKGRTPYSLRVLRPRRIAALTSALVLALPGAALAGGAGDDQYEDPFGDEPTQSEPAQTPDAGEGAPEAEPAPADPAPQAAPAPAEAAPAASSGAPTLPRTGADAALVALAGGALVLAGAALRRRTADDVPR